IGPIQLRLPAAAAVPAAAAAGAPAAGAAWLVPGVAVGGVCAGCVTVWRFMPADLAPPRRRASASRVRPRPRARTRAIRPRLFFMVVVPLWRDEMRRSG